MNTNKRNSCTLLRIARAAAHSAMAARADVERGILTSELRSVESAAGHPSVVFARFSLGDGRRLGLKLSSENVIVALEELSVNGTLRVGDKIVAVNGAPADRSYTETMIHGAAEVGAEVAFIATRVPPALEPEVSPVLRADAVSTMDSSSGSERQSSISIGSAACFTPSACLNHGSCSASRALGRFRAFLVRSLLIRALAPSDIFLSERT